MKALQPAPSGKRVVIWDAGLQSFGIRVTDRGVRSFFVMRRRAGSPKPVRVVLGTYPALSLADARKKAGGALEALAAGDHPREREAIRQRAVARQRANSVEHVASRIRRPIRVQETNWRCHSSTDQARGRGPLGKTSDHGHCSARRDRHGRGDWRGQAFVRSSSFDLLSPPIQLGDIAGCIRARNVAVRSSGGDIFLAADRLLLPKVLRRRGRLRRTQALYVHFRGAYAASAGITVAGAARSDADLILHHTGRPFKPSAVVG